MRRLEKPVLEHPGALGTAGGPGQGLAQHQPLCCGRWQDTETCLHAHISLATKFAAKLSNRGGQWLWVRCCPLPGSGCESYFTSKQFICDNSCPRATEGPSGSMRTDGAMRDGSSRAALREGCWLPAAHRGAPSPQGSGGPTASTGRVRALHLPPGQRVFPGPTRSAGFPLQE